MCDDHVMICPNCHDANSCGDYEGPTCEVCKGYGFVPRIVDTGDELHQILGEALAVTRPHQRGGS
jgi:DnaJ-class molecular chaperone